MIGSTSGGPKLREAGALEPTESVGPLEMWVSVAQATTEGADRWAQRAAALSAWLAAEWQREHFKVRR